MGGKDRGDFGGKPVEGVTGKERGEKDPRYRLASCFRDEDPCFNWP